MTEPGRARVCSVFVRPSVRLSHTGTRGVQEVRKLTEIDIPNFTDIVPLGPLVSTICRNNIARLIIRPHLTTM